MKTLKFFEFYVFFEFLFENVSFDDFCKNFAKKHRNFLKFQNFHENETLQFFNDFSNILLKKIAFWKFSMFFDVFEKIFKIFEISKKKKNIRN
jgi:hypothetical protein